MSMHKIAETNQAMGFVLETKHGNILASTKTTPRANDPIIDTQSSQPYALWGRDNLRPQKLIEAVEKSDLAPMIIDWKVKALYSQGLAYGYEVMEGDQVKLVRVHIPEHEQFLEHININKYMIEAGNDLYTLNNFFVDFQLNLGREIDYLGRMDASFCRLSLQSKPSGSIDTCFVNANWPLNATSTDCVPISAIDPYYNQTGQIRDGKKFRYIAPMRDQIRGRVHYAKASWEGLLDSGWLELAGEIPKSKLAMMKNTLAIKWHLKIPDYYWEWRFKDWAKLSNDERNQKISDVLTEFMKFMSGSEKTGAAFISHFKFDPHRMKEYPGWKIEPIKGDTKGGEYIEDSQEADFHITRGFGVPPQIIGISPGKAQAAGSGSDVRVHFNKYILEAKADQDKLVSPIQWMADINNLSTRYKNELKGNRMKHWCGTYYLATLDQVNNDKRI